MTSILTLSKQTQIFEFLDIIYSSYLILHITSLTRLPSRSHTLIDNIMSNVITEVAISEKIINTISDYFGQFLYHIKLKTRISPKNLKNFSRNNFLSHLKKINWESLFSQHKQQVNLIYTLFLDKIINLLQLRNWASKKMKIWKNHVGKRNSLIS